MNTITVRAINGVRYLLVTLAILAVAAVAQHYRDEQARLMVAQKEAEAGVPRIASGPTVEDLVRNLQDQGVEVNMEMFQP